MPNMKAPYWNRKLPIDKRVNDLLKRMTLDEKVAQLTSIWKDPIIDHCAKENGDFNEKNAKKVMKHGLGIISAIFRTFTTEHNVKISNQIQQWLRENTRLGIPVLTDAEGLHGSFCIGSTCFPQSISLAASWNPELVGRMATAVGKELRVRGIHQVLSPVLDVARDARCGRVEETYGEDPLLVTRMAMAYVKAVQAQRIIATPKHFVANFVGDGGRDSNPIHMSERLLREIYLPPYEAVFKEAGALSVMAAYHSMDGTPCNAHKWLLTDLLRGEYGFKGHVVSDWFAVPIMHDKHLTAETKADAALNAISAGMDLELPINDCYKYLKDLVKSGRLPMKVMDKAVRNFLRNKFWAGLFDDPYREADEAVEIVNCPAHRALALEIARQTPVLLKNEKILPLKRSVKTIAVIGPNAAVARLGGYTTTGATGISPLDGIKKTVKPGTEVLYAEGCKLKGGDKKGFARAIRMAKKAEVVVLCVGNCAYETEGEGSDRCNLDLPGFQEELVLEIAKANPNVAVVLNGGSAVTMQKWLAQVKGILEAWFLGQEGGTALAEILFGTVNPSGKLPITFPVTTGQCPLYYNTKPTGRSYDYNDLRGKQPRFPFGFGLSYTTFDYKKLRVRKSGAGKNVKVTVTADIRNTGKRAGGEIVQLYIHDKYSKLSRPLKELKGFTKVSLKPRQKKTVKFELTAKDFMYLGENMKPVLEPGVFEIMVAASSDDVRLSKQIKLR